MFNCERDPLTLLVELTPKLAKRRYRQSIYEAWDYCCGYCNEPATSLDHIIPKFSSGSSYRNNLIPNLIIYTINRKLNLPDRNFKGEKAITYKDLRWKRRDIKTVSLLGNVIAKNEAVKRNAFEAILVEKGKVTEATSSNVWIVKNNKLITHPANTDILKGITSEAIKNIIKKNKLKLLEKIFTTTEMYKADEVFITSSGNLLTPIIKIDSILINKGKIGDITLQLALLYAKLFNVK